MIASSLKRNWLFILPLKIVRRDQKGNHYRLSLTRVMRTAANFRQYIGNVVGR
jgi:hypothetical protein